MYQYYSLIFSGYPWNSKNCKSQIMQGRNVYPRSRFLCLSSVCKRANKRKFLNVRAICFIELSQNWMYRSAMDKCNRLVRAIIPLWLWGRKRTNAAGILPEKILSIIWLHFSPSLFNMVSIFALRYRITARSVLLQFALNLCYAASICPLQFFYVHDITLTYKTNSAVDWKKTRNYLQWIFKNDWVGTIALKFHSVCFHTHHSMTYRTK